MKKQKRCDNHPSRVRKVYFRILIKEITIHFLYISNNCWKKEKVVERKSRMMWKKAEPKNIKRFRFFFSFYFWIRFSNNTRYLNRGLGDERKGWEFKRFWESFSSLHNTALKLFISSIYSISLIHLFTFSWVSFISLIFVS